MLSIDLQTGETTDHGQAPEPCVMWLGDEARNTRWVGSTRDAGLHWFGPFDGPLVEVEQDVDFRVVGRSMASNRLLFVVPPMTSRSSAAPPPSDSIQLIDVETGAIVGDGVDQVQESQWRPWATSPDGRLVAIAQAVPG